MNSYSTLRLLLVVAVAAVANAASAQVFECVDAKGAREYAQFCRPGTVQQRQILKESESGAGASRDARSAPKSLEVQDVEYRKRLLERQEAETKAAQDKQQAEEAESQCAAARNQIKALEDGQRMTRIDPESGERLNFGDDERAMEIERQRQAMAAWCKS
jgi:hypothetical protein